MTQVAMVPPARILSQLESVDWDFPGATTPVSSVHSLHWFPGNFIPQIPSHLIEILSEPGDLVLDPFAGSGTTGFEAALLGRHSIQADINRASVGIADAKLMFLTPGMPRLILEFARALPVGPLFEPAATTHAPHGSERPRAAEGKAEVADWFHPATHEELLALWRTIRRQSSGALLGVLEMLFTDLLFFCASTRGSSTSGGNIRKHHWGWVADNVKPRPVFRHHPLEMYRDRLERAHLVAKGLEGIIGNLVIDAEVRCEDFRRCTIPDSSVDVIVTSPPYLGMIDYAMANRLTYHWFGWDLQADRVPEIGARWKRERQAILAEYLEDMECCFEQMSRVLKAGAFCAIVVGASSKFPSALDSLFRIATRHLRVVWGPRPRVPSRRRVSGGAGGPPTEMVVVYQK